ncbi:DUF2924 domain-containing protein [Bartonella tamiae]|uniref:DUF2924 domain-containing protein n=1 Tax=Bartonella tamiae Th239 TaxID=1094558 RepID=J1JYW9_9HYPH|nr:DUF2924 domain-containing protein [Bartonella tamiae]EJF90297.1 hypothetical protein ME5_00698 [Bartonella tamiae Th239]EJF93762.1 hypothetical protein MEG_01186 [Bartonella tamiae Th307]
MIDTGSLETLKRSDLLDLWRNVITTPPSRTMGRNVMCGILAFEIQSKQYGGLNKTFQKELKRYETALNAGKIIKTKGHKLRQGSRLLREWNGITHHVEVTENGYLWNGKLYRSLSSIAKAITGTHWSGPRFFGLNSKDAHHGTSGIGYQLHERDGEPA